MSNSTQSPGSQSSRDGNKKRSLKSPPPAVKTTQTSQTTQTAQTNQTTKPKEHKIKKRKSQYPKTKKRSFYKPKSGTPKSGLKSPGRRKLRTSKIKDPKAQAESETKSRRTSKIKRPSVYALHPANQQGGKPASPNNSMVLQPPKDITNTAAAFKPDPVALNIARLHIGSGKKTQADYRDAIMNASSPSQLSFRQISEQYTIPDENFQTSDDVFRHRGYRKVGKIDEGAFGVVSKAWRLRDSLEVAIKEVDLRRKRTKRIEEMKRELFVLQKVNHLNVVQFLEHFVVGQTLVIVLEYCAGGNLTTYLKRVAVDETEALSLFKQMAQGIKVLHRLGIAHRDVKLNNFLLDATRRVVKVSDFGLSVVSFKTPNEGLIMAKTYCGTEPYMAPELLRRNSLGLRSYYPIFADIWSLGVCLFAMLTRTFPFKMQLSQRGLFKAQTTRRWRFPRTLKLNLSEEIRDLVWHMLDPEPERRITIIGVLAHPWLNKGSDFEISINETASVLSKNLAINNGNNNK